MKLIEMAETESSLVFTVHGSKVSRIAKKGDPADVTLAIAEIMAEAPETKPVEPEPDEQPAEAAEGVDLQETMGGLLEGIGQLLKSPEAQRARSFLEKLPKPKKKDATG